jgi:hypothetical protein
MLRSLAFVLERHRTTKMAAPIQMSPAGMYARPYIEMSLVGAQASGTQPVLPTPFEKHLSLLLTFGAALMMKPAGPAVSAKVHRQSLPSPAETQKLRARQQDRKRSCGG